ncbi:MAG: bifunctional UDP-N-acetylglucosamine diphosphorylase/glucosamine-1-phosphate N-acetyltransferase GlmU [Bacteroidota bacterium]
MAGFVAIVLAAGLGTRMKSRIPKVMHEICGKPMVSYVLDAVEAAGAKRVIVVVGHGADLVKQAVGARGECVLQAEQLGTGHAVMQVEGALGDYGGMVAVIAGDAAFLAGDDLAELVAGHRESGAAATVLSAVLEDPTGYGRIIRGAQGEIVRIVEEKDASPAEAAVNEVNSSIYCFSAPRLFEALHHIAPDNTQGEYYLTDVIGIMIQTGLPVRVVRASDPLSARGINTRVQLAEAERIFRDRVRERLMLSGVTLVDPPSTFIDADVAVGRDTVILPFTFLQGKTIIGEGCTIGPFVRMADTTVADGASVSNAVVTQSTIGSGATVGPYSFLRPGTILEERAKVGTFVEVKKSIIGKGSKVPHQTYLGDATVGEGVNIGAGTITCNYDGWQKHPTVIENGVFIGSNSNLVAPVRIGRGAYVAAGSTITRDVPEGALGIARGLQREIPDWVKRRLERRQKAEGHGGHSSNESGGKQRDE